MSSRNVMTQQERFALVARFIKSGESHSQWCKEHDINPSTLYRWRSEYKKMQQDVCFVPLKSKTSESVQLTSEKEETINQVLIEIGSCKIHLPEHLAIELLNTVFKEVVTNHV
ncbi:MAG: transposase [Enterococcus sp.]|nr:transposase [Enterococcus sp.]